MIYTNKTNTITIEVRQQNARQIAWALFVNGQYQKTKILPRNNTAVVQNFGFLANDFVQA
jgi:hypothetical protein